MTPLNNVLNKCAVALCFVSLFSWSATAQVFQENFEQGIPNTWTLIDNDGNVANSQVGGTIAGTTTSWFLTVDADATRDTTATSNSWLVGFDTGCNPASTCQSDDWLITPPITLTTNNVLSWDAISVDDQFLESYEVLISTTTPTIGAFSTTLFSTNGENGTWTNRSVNLQAQGFSNQQVYIAFRNTSNDNFFLRVDNVLVQQQASDDVGITEVTYGEYVFYPLSQIRPIPLSATVENSGANTATNVTVTTTGFDVSNGVTQVYSGNASTASLASGASTTINMPTSFTPGDTGTFVFQFVVTMTQTDGDATNDTSLAIVVVDETLFARDDALIQGGSPISSVGFGVNSPTNDMGNLFTLSAGDSLQMVEFFLTDGEINDVVSVNIYNTAGGLPTTLVASTVTETVLTPADTQRVYSLAISGGPVFLPAGTYYFGVRGADYIGLAEDVYTPSATVGGNTNTGFFLIDTLSGGAFPGSFVVWPHLEGHQQANDDIGIISAFNGEYTVYPLSQIRPVPFAVSVENFGTNTATNATADITVTDGLGNVLYNAQSFPSTINPGATSFLVPPATWTPPDTGAGVYLIQYLVSMDQADANANNDTSYFIIFIDDSLMARDDALIGPNPFYTASPLSGLGFNTLASQIDVGNTFNLVNDDTLHKVEFFLNTGLVGDTLSANIYATSSGVPTGSPIASTVEFIITNPADTSGVFALDIAGGPVGLSAGTYFVGVRGGRFIGFAEKIYTSNSIWAGETNVPFFKMDTLSQGPFLGAFVVWPYLASSPCPTISLSTSTTNDTCTAQNGTATVTATGGSTYTYQWDANAGNQTTATATGLAFGTYSVTVTAGNGCTTATTTATVSQTFSTITATPSSTDNASCATPNGTATVAASGGTGTYTYAWNDANNQTTATATGLDGGNYSVTVTDGNGCTVAVNTTVGSTTATVTVSFTEVDQTNCSTPDGSSTAAGAGGTGPYTYQWDANANNQATAAATGLAAGSYDVTVTDANGCTGTGTSTVGDNTPAISATFSTSDNTSCATPNGSATATGTGGTGPYTYQWDANANNQATATAAGLSGGSYTVTVTDANGCTGTATATVGSTVAVVTVSTSTTDLTSCLNVNGSATATPSGGSAPYTYAWSPSGATATINNLVAGTYTVTVSDVNGCSGTASATVNDATPSISLNVTASVPNSSCTTPNGSATVTATGASGFTYLWDANAGNQSGATASGLPAGTYSVTATDNISGCTATASAVVGNNTPTVTATTVTNGVTDCVSSNGSATVTGNGGAGNFTYQWDANANNQATATASNLDPGTYTVVVTDANGCTASATATVADNRATVNVNITKTDNTSCVSANGTAVGTATGGQSPYTYAWSNNQSGSTQNGLASGAYTVTATDANGCEGTASTTIGNNTGNLAATATATDETTATADDGTATATANGGTAPYTYSWSNSGTSATITGLDAGTYTVTITDANGCTATATATVGTGVGVIDIEAGFAFNVYPNPTNGNVTVALDFNESQDVQIEWFNILGERIINDELKNVTSITEAYDLTNLANGVYLARVTFGEYTIVERVSVNR